MVPDAEDTKMSKLRAFTKLQRRQALSQVTYSQQATELEFNPGPDGLRGLHSEIP